MFETEGPAGYVSKSAHRGEEMRYVGNTGQRAALCASSGGRRIYSKTLRDSAAGHPRCC